MIRVILECGLNNQKFNCIKNWHSW